MLNMNLDMDIENFVTVGYKGLREVIDGLGGIYIDVDETELKHINNYQISIVEEGGKLCNIPLMEMAKIVKCRVLVCAVLRNGTAMVPRGSFVLQAGDRIFVTAPTENLTILLKNLDIFTRRVRKVMLCGGGRVSYFLAHQLKKSGIRVRLLEADYERCRELDALLPEAEIVHGDPSNLEVLESEGLTDCDAMVTLTGRDELNMILSLYGSRQGVAQVITKLEEVGERSVIDSLSLGSVICPKELCCNNIVRYVRAMQNQTGAAVSVHAIADGQVEAMEFLVDQNTKHCDTPLKQLKTKPNVLIASITHGSSFNQGDTLVVVTSGRGVIKQINDIFA